jgi:hypothetical protein
MHLVHEIWFLSAELHASLHSLATTRKPEDYGSIVCLVRPESLATLTGNIVVVMAVQKKSSEYCWFQMLVFNDVSERSYSTPNIERLEVDVSGSLFVLVMFSSKPGEWGGVHIYIYLFRCTYLLEIFSSPPLASTDTRRESRGQARLRSLCPVARFCGYFPMFVNKDRQAFYFNFSQPT